MILVSGWMVAVEERFSRDRYKGARKAVKWQPHERCWE